MISNDKVKYSVVIPAYNAEGNIVRCLQSLLSQGRDDIEIIVIDDGSTDRTAEIVKELIDTNCKGDFIHYINKENGGVSSARNMGILSATGTYITFVDSDDFVDSRYFEVLDRIDDCDLLVFQVVPGGKQSDQDWENYIPNLNSTFESLYWLQKHGKMNSPWNKRFKRSIILQHGIHFLKDVQIAEDHLFCLSYALQCESITIIPDFIYHYQADNPGSLSNRYRKDMFLSMLEVSTAAEKQVRDSRLKYEEKQDMYYLLDYLFVIRAVNSIAEEFKIRRFNYFRDRERTRSICQSFAHRIGDNSRYRNYFHHYIRFLLDHKMYFLTYCTAFAAKYKRTRQYRMQHPSFDSKEG